MTEVVTVADAARAANLEIEVAGERFAYRRIGNPSVTLPPLVLLQHFRGNLDYWDPALLDVLAADREVLTVDLRGVGGSTGTTPDNVTDMARDALQFIDALGLTSVDLLGFSLGGHIAQEIALVRPRLPRRLVLAGTAPQGAPDLHRWSEDVYTYACADEITAEGFIALFFSGSQQSVQRGWEYLARTHARSTDRDPETTLACRDAQYQALMTWGIPESSKLERLSAITQPTLVANGDNDTMMSTKNSYLLAEKIRGAQLRVYPDAGHGFLDQYPVEFGQHIRQFLGR
ncbi:MULTISPECIES: alpha/beta fold hydrolase [Mycobacteriaceae]|uniref:Alpha/beta hydrolase n=1 Tax=Mycolicibacterium mucogenicum DSM 44124 TaxID=1226753 RepID=A0A8H2JFF7_MYCMU|nr:MULTISPECIES: alpha/beta hydrolase [Mycobacteriaceae]KAB7753184.1 alpha/beta hydrolase [Mycolicibacterium mucogenicum DSM 44124]MCT7372252.1 alpha/beta hydrolase [Mycolicibacterium llatzerense]QPG67199.1 alpha/beta hydrolase [Mycolicibacterium mucogenicum DSM 44124]SEB26966.1 Pimeloyl-ACP methyl ester carboxylesterase [Mycobacterium sp. 283mftsu]